mmetsp:Transcript_19004/g.53305  ORF Transcript_19004/g.53305 Transcript_19004/m.53305 type:complete len:286 (+) Transcript_19004:126-983(+)
MAERKAVNKYYPPDWDPSKGSINTYRNSHPLRERARKLDKGILIVRFELPYNIWCDGCKSHIGKGVRYNAEKSAAGKYYSTKLWKFRMKCHLCPNRFEIQTDPENRDYKILNGATRKTETYTAESAETIELGTKTEEDFDPLRQLEKGTEDKAKASKEAPRMRELIGISHLHRDDDFSANQVLRQGFRKRKREFEEEREERFAKNIYFPLEETEETTRERDRDEFRTKRLILEDRSKKRVVSTSKVRSTSIFQGSASYGLKSGKSQKKHEVRVSAVAKRRRLSSP